MLKDSLLQSTSAYTIDWPHPNDTNFQSFADNLLINTAHDNDSATDGYVTDNEYDALDRTTQTTLPKDVHDNRKVITPTYSRSGALESVTFDGVTYVSRIAYNAKGQRLLIAFGNDTMTRYTYDDETFRLLRQRTESYIYEPATHNYSSGGSVVQDNSTRSAPLRAG